MTALIGLIGAWISAAAAIYAFFPRADRALRAEARIGLTCWLRGSTNPHDNWRALFTELFDKIFRVRFFHPVSSFVLSLPAIGRSALASLLSVVVMAFVWLSFFPTKAELSVGAVLPGVAPNPFIQYDLVFRQDGLLVNARGVDVSILIPVLLNFLPDFISLIQTRWVLSRLSVAKSRAAVVSWLAGDAVATLGIALVAFFCVEFWFLTKHLGIGFERAVGTAFFTFWRRLLISDDPIFQMDGIFIYSTFLTSAWLWLFILGSLVVRLLQVIPSFVRLANQWFDLDRQLDKSPLQVLGYVVIAFASAGLALGFVLTS